MQPVERAASMKAEMVRAADQHASQTEASERLDNGARSIVPDVPSAFRRRAAARRAAR